MEEAFYTLKGYQLKEKIPLTEAMEDYMEMIYRSIHVKQSLRVKQLAMDLNVRPSSVSKMVNKLKELGYLNFPKYGEITLTELGQKKGKYLLERHNILVQFFTLLNREEYRLEQVEKIEHFMDEKTIQNIENLLIKKEEFLFLITNQSS